MSSVFILLGLLAAAHAQVPSAVRPGALVAPVGTVLVVEDVVTVCYDIGHLSTLYGQIPALAQHLSGLKSTFSGVLAPSANVTLDPALSATLSLTLERMNTIGARVMALANDFPTNSIEGSKRSASSRHRRGLFDLGGLLLNKLFGTAMAADVSALGQKLNVVSQAVETQGRLLYMTMSQIRHFKVHLNTVVERAKTLSRQFHSISTQIASLENIFLLSYYLNELDSDVHLLQERATTLVASLVNAGLSRVNSQLLPVDHLRAALHHAKSNFSLTPLFKEEELEFYYPLLETTLTENSILVHIPLKSEVMYHAYTVLPFPIMVNNSLLSLVTHSDTVLVAADFMSVSLTQSTVLAKCRSSYLHIHVCPAYLFALLPAESTPCELAVVRNNTAAIHSSCKFEPVFPSRPSYHAHIDGTQYFYFKEAASVTLICGSRHTNVIAQGYYAAPDFCEVRSSAISTLPSRQHRGFNYTIPSSLVPLFPSFDVSLINVSIVSDRLKVLSYLNDSDIFVSSVPSFLHPHVLYPTVSLPIIVLLVVIVVLCVCLRRLESRLEDIREASNLVVVPPVSPKG